jgi:predicted HTH transcriptional regulator
MNVPLPEYVIERDRTGITFRLPEKKDGDMPENPVTDTSNLTDTESRIYAPVCTGSDSTVAEISESAGISFRRTKRAVERLAERGYIHKMGGKKIGKWAPVSRLK